MVLHNIFEQFLQCKTYLKQTNKCRCYCGENMMWWCITLIYNVALGFQTVSCIALAQLLLGNTLQSLHWDIFHNVCVCVLCLTLPCVCQLFHRYARQHLLLLLSLIPAWLRHTHHRAARAQRQQHQAPHARAQKKIFKNRIYDRNYYLT